MFDVHFGTRLPVLEATTTPYRPSAQVKHVG
jgi:hypothetical protein